MLIFFGSVRKNVIALFHYALNPGGFLVLGPSETESGNLFSIVEGAHSIYTKNETVGKRHPFYPADVGPRRTADGYKRVARVPASELANEHRPAKGTGARTPVEIQRGRCSSGRDTWRFWKSSARPLRTSRCRQEKSSFNLLKLIPETRLFLEVEKLVREVKNSGEAARKDRVPYQSDGAAGEVNVEVIPLGGTNTRALLVLFEPAPGASEHRAGPQF